MQRSKGQELYREKSTSSELLDEQCGGGRRMRGLKHNYGKRRTGAGSRRNPRRKRLARRRECGRAAADTAAADTAADWQRRRRAVRASGDGGSARAQAYASIPCGGGRSHQLLAVRAPASEARAISQPTTQLPTPPNPTQLTRGACQWSSLTEDGPDTVVVGPTAEHTRRGRLASRRPCWGPAESASDEPKEDNSGFKSG